MKITGTSSIIGIVGPRSRSLWDFEVFLHLPQYKLSLPMAQLWYKLEANIKHVCLSGNNKQNL